MRFLNSFLILIAIGVFATSCNSAFNKAMKINDPDVKFKAAEDYFSKGKYKNAQALYEAVLPIYKGKDKFEEVYYKYAYSFYNQKMYLDAENMFKGYLEMFPNSQRGEEVTYMRAISYYKQSPKVELDQKNTERAISMMLAFINTYPTSPRVAEATKIIDEGRLKLEDKDYKTAALYYSLGHYRASAIAYTDLLNKYPETLKGDEYLYNAIKSYYKYAELSMVEKQAERYSKVVDAYQDFQDRFPESVHFKNATEFYNNSLNKIKELENEQTTPAG